MLSQGLEFMPVWSYGRNTVFQLQLPRQLEITKDMADYENILVGQSDGWEGKGKHSYNAIVVAFGRGMDILAEIGHVGSPISCTPDGMSRMHYFTEQSLSMRECIRNGIKPIH